ncbi:hypothetical protein, partial [Alistipes finegoldii]|uniref:hypothetical protein n=1 Tax=Alistipes finegoldii TaxID=214856 RepID=UPI003AB25908
VTIRFRTTSAEGERVLEFSEKTSKFVSQFFLFIKNLQLFYPTRYEKIITVSAAFHFGRGGGFPAPTMIRPFRNRKP